jgi:hypothetical protein
MLAPRGRFRLLAVSALLVGLFVIPETAQAASISQYEFATPLFGLDTAPSGDLLVADAGAGIVRLKDGKGKLIVELPGVTDMAPIGDRSMWAVTGGGEDETAGTLFLARKGHAEPIADMIAFEEEFNPDGGVIESNPFDVATLSGRRALVADAAGNDLLVVDRKGNIDWVATFPQELVSTDDIKELVGCPNPPPEFEEICDLPPMMPADSVPTSVTIGKDGAYYVGELKGFPAPRNESRIWRIDPGTRHARCGTPGSAHCKVVADGFTSIIDLNVGRDGTIYVTEFDEASWFAVEIGKPEGGTVNACNPKSWSCKELATGLLMSVATTEGKRGKVYTAINALIPGEAEVIRIK